MTDKAEYGEPRVHVVKTRCHGYSSYRFATHEEVENGLARAYRYGHYNCPTEGCPIVEVLRHPACSRCGRVMEPARGFDPGTGHWEPCGCPSWEQRARVAEAALAAVNADA